ncbi:MAG: chromosome partitioning protein ParB, partial [Clostridia bacterium]|nr:chromosome partitioning protein ParB [Clostridia bacterium]
TRDTIGREMGESGANVQRYIRLNELIPELLNLVDIGNLGFNTAVELSYLHVDTQKDVWAAIEVSGNYPSGAQAKEFRSLHKEGALDLNRVLSVLTKGKKDTERLVLSSKILYQYFPKSYTPREMEAIIEKLLAKWAEDGNGGVF